MRRWLSVIRWVGEAFPHETHPFWGSAVHVGQDFKVGFGVFGGGEHDGRVYKISKTTKGKLFSGKLQV